MTAKSADFEILEGGDAQEAEEMEALGTSPLLATSNMASRKHHEVSMRAVSVYLKADGKTSTATEAITGIPAKTISALYRRAVDRGFDPTTRPLVLTDHHVADAPRVGRPKKRTTELTKRVVDKASM